MLYLAQSCSPTKKRKNKKHEQEGHEGISWLLLLYSEVYSTRKQQSINNQLMFGYKMKADVLSKGVWRMSNATAIRGCIWRSPNKPYSLSEWHHMQGNITVRK